jgi:hypothetical protein
MFEIFTGVVPAKADTIVPVTLYVLPDVAVGVDL